MSVELTDFGVDWEGPTPSSEWDGPMQNESQPFVDSPDTASPLTNDDCLKLRRRINPLLELKFHGVDLFMQTLSFIHDKLERPL